MTGRNLSWVASCKSVQHFRKSAVPHALVLLESTKLSDEHNPASPRIFSFAKLYVPMCSIVLCRNLIRQCLHFQVHSAVNGELLNSKTHQRSEYRSRLLFSGSIVNESLRPV